MTVIYQNLYQFTQYISKANLSIHQYLFNTNPAIMFATGTVHDIEKNLPKIQQLLYGKELKYVFVSHIESDECGGIAVLHRNYPNVKVICSKLGARELSGYGYDGKLIAVEGGDRIIDGELSLSILDYPSEVHLQNGILCYEENSGIFYSSDLMFRWGNGEGQTISSPWSDEVNTIDEQRIPNKALLQQMKNDLIKQKPSLIAVGHGFCIIPE